MFFTRGFLPSGEEVYFLNISLLCPVPVFPREHVAGGKRAESESSAHSACAISQAAAARGVIDCSPFQELLGRLERLGPCLCSYYARTRPQAMEESTKVAFILRYFNSESFAESRAFRRIVRAYTDHAPRAANAAPRCTDYKSYPPAVRSAYKACRRAGFVLVYCEHEDRFWFERAPNLSKFLRRLSRRVRQKGGALQVHAPEVFQLVALPQPAAVQTVALHSLERKIFWGLLEEFAASDHAKERAGNDCCSKTPPNDCCSKTPPSQTLSSRPENRPYFT